MPEKLCPKCFHPISVHTELGCCGEANNCLGCGCLSLTAPEEIDSSLLMIAADKILLARVGSEVEIIGFDDPLETGDVWIFRVCQKSITASRRKVWQMIVSDDELRKVAIEQQSIEQIQGKAPKKSESDARAREIIGNDDFFSDRS